MTGRRSASSLLAGVLLVGLVSAQSPQRPPQVPGAIRTGITVVPIDVRVLDAAGNPVTDLTREDFTIVEDGVPQAIQHFFAVTRTPDTAAPGARPALRRAAASGIEPQNQRIFLIVLGRGRLQYPAMGLDALIRFVRTKLLPQDHVAVMAYNRATDFTTSHEDVARTLESFRKRNDSIESKLAHHFSGLQAVYGSRLVPPHIQKEIDAVFGDPGTLAARSLEVGSLNDVDKMQDSRRISDALLDEEIRRGREAFDAFESRERYGRMSFDEYVRLNRQTSMDLGSIYSGVEYLRYLEGEKHLLFLTTGGLFLPRVENDVSIAAFANDARVAIDNIHTGGVPPAPSPGAVLARGRAVRGGGFDLPPSFDPPATARRVSELTGGQVSLFSYAEKALDRIDRATRAGYLLGYSPSNTTWNGRYRRVTVKVNRPGVTVHYRHGYYGREELVPYDRQQFVTYSRVASAGSFDRPISDIRLTLGTPAIAGTDPREVMIDVTIDLSRVTFTLVDGRHVASLDLAIFCGDRHETVVGESWQKVDLALSDDAYRRLLKTGAVHAARVAVNAPPQYVKVVVYDYDSDLVGSAVARLRNP